MDFACSRGHKEAKILVVLHEVVIEINIVVT